MWLLLLLCLQPPEGLLINTQHPPTQSTIPVHIVSGMLVAGCMHRTMPLYQQLWAVKQHVMPIPDVFIGGVGTEVYHWTGNGFQPDLAWQQQLQQGWNLAAVQSAVEQLMQQYTE